MRCAPDRDARDCPADVLAGRVLDLVDFAGAVKLQPEMSRQLQALGKQVYAELKKALAKLPEDQRALYDLKKLQSLKVTYGVKSQGARVRINE